MIALALRCLALSLVDLAFTVVIVSGAAIRHWTRARTFDLNRRRG